LEAKPRDIHFSLNAPLEEEEPFLADESTMDTDVATVPILQSLDHTTTCLTFVELGECGNGLRCRFLGAHAKLVDGKIEVLKDEEKIAHQVASKREVNGVGNDVLTPLRKKQVSKSLIDYRSNTQTAIPSIPRQYRKGTSKVSNNRMQIPQT
jgi:tRNA-dihydrouridine synthase 3